jgi:adenylate cyclase
MLLSLLLGISLSLSGELDKIDQGNIDIYHVITGARYEAKKTVIVSLDTDALDMYPNTPLVFWGPNYAKAINQLKEAGAVAIALDIYFAITPEQWLRTLDNLESLPQELIDYDQTFDQALSEGRVILATNPISGKGKNPVPLPAEEYLAALPTHLEGVGLTTLLRDADGRIRRMVPAFEGIQLKQKDGSPRRLPEGYQTPNPWWTFAALAVSEGFGKKALDIFHNNAPFQTRLINYSGPPGNVPRISLAAFFREQGLTSEERAKIAGRIVFIGTDHEIFGDHQLTPYSHNFLWYGHRDMSGVEIHANIAETILSQNQMQTVPMFGVLLLWGGIMSLAAVSCELNIKPMALYVVKGTSIILLWPIGYVLFQYGYLLPQAGCFTSIMFFFLTIAIIRTAGAHHRTKNLIGYKAFDNIFHDRRDRRETDRRIHH